MINFLDKNGFKPHLQDCKTGKTPLDYVACVVFKRIKKCEAVKEYLDNLFTHVGTPRVFGTKSILSDHNLWHDNKKKSLILA